MSKAHPIIRAKCLPTKRPTDGSGILPDSHSLKEVLSQSGILPDQVEGGKAVVCGVRVVSRLKVSSGSPIHRIWSGRSIFEGPSPNLTLGEVGPLVLRHG